MIMSQRSNCAIEDESSVRLFKIDKWCFWIFFTPSSSSCHRLIQPRGSSIRRLVGISARKWFCFRTGNASRRPTSVTLTRTGVAGKTTECRVAPPIGRSICALKRLCVVAESWHSRALGSLCEGNEFLHTKLNFISKNHQKPQKRWKDRSK